MKVRIVGKHKDGGQYWWSKLVDEDSLSKNAYTRFVPKDRKKSPIIIKVIDPEGTPTAYQLHGKVWKLMPNPLMDVATSTALLPERVLGLSENDQKAINWLEVN